MTSLQKQIPGIVLATVIGLAGYFASGYLPSSLGSILLALLLGMLVGNVARVPENFQSGIGFTSSKLLEFSILFLAFSISFSHIAKLGWVSFSIIAVMVVLMVLFTYYLANKIKCPGATGWLVGFGTTICGSSAIAALAPGVSKSQDDVAISMAVVNLFGTLGMIVMPVVLMKMHLSDEQMGLLIGGTLHSVGNVAGAGYTVSNHVGEASITIKLARVALLSPALIFFNYLVNRHNVKSWKDHFSLPWYLWGYIIITVLVSLVHFPVAITGIMETAGKVILTIAMAAIGLKVSFKKLYRSGRKGLGFGLIVFVVQLLLVVILMQLV